MGGCGEAKNDPMTENNPNSTLVNVKDTDAMEGDLEMASPQEKELSEIETTPSKIMLTKEQLPTANCCRLCALGSEVDVHLNSIINEFVPLFKDNKENITSTPIHRLINKYLPIEVLESDPFYPIVICQGCLNCMERTVDFFDKIFEGQRLLANILNCLSKEKPAKHGGSTFSRDNPLHKVAKRRGRPRKLEATVETSVTPSSATSSEVKNGAHATEISAQLPEKAERRTKRQSRPPVRYVDEVLPNTFRNDAISEEVEEEVAQGESGPSSTVIVVSNECNETGADYVNYSIQPEFSIAQQQVADFGKFNIVMNDEGTGIPVHSFHLASTDRVGLFLQEDSAEEDNVEENNGSGNQNKSKKDEAADKTVKLHNLYRSKRKKKRPPKGNVQCDQCPKKFNHSSSLAYHRLSVHDKSREFSCSICGKCFSHKQLLTSHLYVHNDKYFNCEACPAKFKSRASLYTHKKSRHSAVKEHTCHVCGTQFGLKSSLVGHMRLHTGEKPFQCDFCQKTFTQRSSLREHRRTHTGEKPYRCPQCPKSFTTLSQLRNHKFCHSNDKTLLCQICGKGFSHTENFKYHMRRHAGEKPVVCQICKKEFAETWTLKKHMRIHNNDKPYQCSIPTCNKQFSDPSNFQKHKRTHSNVQKVEATFAETEQSMEEYLLPEDSVKEELLGSRISIGGTLGAGVDGSGNYITADGTTSSIVQILDSDNLTFRTMTHDDEVEAVEQVIYVYSGEGSLFTFAMPNDPQSESHEVPVESVDQTVDGMDVGITAGLESFNPNDIESHYYSLERVGESTIAVPIQMPLSGPETHHNPGNSHHS